MTQSMVSGMDTDPPEMPAATASIPSDESAERPPPSRKLSLGARLSGAFLVLLVLVSAFLPLRFDPNRPDARAVLASPNSNNWFGTDQAGLDVFTRTITAAHTDLLLALSGATIAMIIGTIIGVIASAPGKLSSLIMRGVDLFQAFPTLIIILTIVSLTGGGYLTLAGVVSLVSLPSFIRLVRAEALSLRKAPFIEYAEIIGCPKRTVIVRHMIPNISGIILAQLTLASATAIGVLAAVSFLGEGVEPPTASWGSMIETGSSNIGTGQWWPVVFPSLALVMSIIALNVLSDGLDSRMGRGRRHG